MPRYRVTLEGNFVNKDDARHWALWVAGVDLVDYDIDVVSVVRHVTLTAVPGPDARDVAPERYRGRRSEQR